MFKIPLPKGLKELRRTVSKRISGVTISTPAGISVSVSPHDLERTVAREVVIFISDKRVITHSECCENCIKYAVESILEIRQFLTQKKLALANFTDGHLFLFIEFLQDGIKQFLTYTESLSLDHHPRHLKRGVAPEEDLPPRELYFNALNILRRHIVMCLKQISNIAAVEPPKIPEYLKLKDWDKEIYADCPTEAPSAKMPEGKS